MEKRVFLAIFLCFVVLAVYQLVFPQARRPQPSTSTTTSIGSPVNEAPVAASSPSAAEAASPTTAPPAAAPLVADAMAREIVVETADVRAVFSTVGAALTSWQLKHYSDNGEPMLELVPRDLPASLPRAFTLATDDPAVSTTLATARFRPSADALDLGTTPGQLIFEYQDQSGLHARKTFYFQPEGRRYVLKVEATLALGGSSRPVTMSLGPWMGKGYEPDGSQYIASRAIQHKDGDVTRIAADDLLEENRFQGEFKFAGVEDQYFRTTPR